MCLVVWSWWQCHHINSCDHIFFNDGACCLIQINKQLVRSLHRCVITIRYLTCYPFLFCFFGKLLTSNIKTDQSATRLQNLEVLKSQDVTPIEKNTVSIFLLICLFKDFVVSMQGLWRNLFMCNMLIFIWLNWNYILWFVLLWQ